MKLPERAHRQWRYGHSSQGEYGLKYGKKGIKSYDLTSLPAGGVWIETWDFMDSAMMKMSLPARGVRIEIFWTVWSSDSAGSLLARGVWIEIFGPFGQAKRDRVALLTESVD